MIDSLVVGLETAIVLACIGILFCEVFFSDRRFSYAHA